jgi:hypothetical protein
VTNLWIKLLWEKVSKFDISVTIATINISPPRKNDQWLMIVVMDTGFTREDNLCIINRMQCHQQVLFLSNVLDSGGRSLDRKYMNRRNVDKTWSSLLFPTEKPPQKHIRKWQEVLTALAQQGRMQPELACTDPQATRYRSGATTPIPKLSFTS